MMLTMTPQAPEPPPLFAFVNLDGMAVRIDLIATLEQRESVKEEIGTVRVFTVVTLTTGQTRRVWEPMSSVLERMSKALFPSDDMEGSDD